MLSAEMSSKYKKLAAALRRQPQSHVKLKKKIIKVNNKAWLAGWCTPISKVYSTA